MHAKVRLYVMARVDRRELVPGERLVVA